MITVQYDFIMVRPMNPLHSIYKHYVVSIILTLGYFLTGCVGSDDPLERFRAGDYEASLKLFGPRADAGDPAARNFIGIHYYLGLGADRDFAAAAKWFEQAALAQNADAQRNLGVMYLRGFGVARDYGQAYGWLYHAYVGGNRTAERYLGFTADLITPNASMQARKRVGAQIKAAATAR